MGNQRKAGPHDMRSAYPVMRSVIHTVLVAWMVMKGTLVPKHNVGVRDIRGARHVGRQIPANVKSEALCSEISVSASLALPVGSAGFSLCWTCIALLLAAPPKSTSMRQMGYACAPIVRGLGGSAQSLQCGR